jgi:hypothetical protein
MIDKNDALAKSGCTKAMLEKCKAGYTKGFESEDNLSIFKGEALKSPD